jgi:hypothetical protein
VSKIEKTLSASGFFSISGIEKNSSFVKVPSPFKSIFLNPLNKRLISEEETVILVDLGYKLFLFLILKFVLLSMFLYLNFDPFF